MNWTLWMLRSHLKSGAFAYMQRQHTTHTQHASIYTAQKWLRQTHPAERRQTDNRVVVKSGKANFDFCAVLRWAELCMCALQCTGTQKCGFWLLAIGCWPLTTLHWINIYAERVCAFVWHCLDTLVAPTSANFIFCPAHFALHFQWNTSNTKCARTEPI